MRIVFLIITLGFLASGVQAQKKATHTLKPLAGKVLYETHCMTCHQVDGAGAQNMIPPLVKTNYVLGNKAHLINIMLKGLSGEITVNGDTYAGEMPALSFLTDSEIAAVLTYVRNNFGNKATAVTSAEVKKIRATVKR